MRHAYHERLASLSFESSMMCKVAGNCLSDANQALLTGDVILAERVIASEKLLNQMRVAAEAQALELLSLQAPVASELRAVVAVLWIVADVQRMGSLAVLVARSCVRRYPGSAVPETVRPIVEEMGVLAVQLADQAGTVLRNRDLTLVFQVESIDHRIDELHRKMFAILLAPNWAGGVGAAVDIALLSRYLERFADHAVAIARHMIFVMTGKTVDSDLTPARPAYSLRGRR